MKIYATNTAGTSTTYLNFSFVSTTLTYGLRYVIEASGGFLIIEGFPEIGLKNDTSSNVVSVDITDAIQLYFDVRKFNQLLGVIKDSSNQTIIESSFNSLLNFFPNDTITLTSADFVKYMSYQQVVSLGFYSCLYRNFNEYINHYFSYGGFSPIFENMYSLTDNTDLYNGVFDASSFMNIITPDDLNVMSVSGEIIISNVNNELRNLIINNPYKNRTPTTQTIEGFIDGDKIYITNGISVTLNLHINNTAPINFDFSSNYCYPIQNDLCPCMDAHISTSQWTLPPQNSQYTEDISINIYEEITSQSITQTTTAPLLLILKNISTDPYEYGGSFASN
jgi:hypothetical protein